MAQLPSLSGSVSGGLKQLQRAKAASAPARSRKPSTRRSPTMGTSPPKGSRRTVSTGSRPVVGTSPPAGYKTSHYRREDIVRSGGFSDTVSHRGTVRHVQEAKLPTARAVAKLGATGVASTYGTKKLIDVGFRVGRRALRSMPVIGPALRLGSVGRTGYTLAKAARSGQKIQKAAAIRALITSGL